MDVTCKRRHHTSELWHAVRAQKQAADITRHRDRYTAGLQALRTYRANIAEVLRKLGQRGHARLRRCLLHSCPRPGSAKPAGLAS
ncbi:hypothetical protein ACFVXW_33705 [Streptomyces sp. NPDC058251]|uniref:hypothetical protein n=1 Tax=Streptomyces sp. NPDC058251 TaxID=3346404 RepID=UPI0036EF21F1